MNDFLTRLIARSRSTAPVIRPRLPSLFESSVAPAGVREEDPAAASGPPRTAVPADAGGETSTARAPLAHQVPASPPLSGAIAPAPPLDPAPFAPRHVAMASPGPAVEPAAPPTIFAPPPPPAENAPRPAPPVETMRPAAHVPTPPMSEAAAPLLRRANARGHEARPSPATAAVRITIGRVEVRAIQPAPPAARPGRHAPPRLSLEDYLRPRPGGGR